MCMLLNSRGQSWTTSPSLAYSWGTRKMSSGTGCDIIFMEDNTIEDWRQQKPKTSSQLTTIIESALVDPISTQLVGRQHPADEVESELVGTQQQS